MLNNCSSYGSSFDIMSSSNSQIPTNIKKLDPVTVATFLKSKKDELFLNEESIQIIERLDFTGEDYLASTDIELQKYNLTPGAVKRIHDELKKQANRDADGDLINETQRGITFGKKGKTSASSKFNSQLPTDIKKWDPVTVVTFLKSKKDELFLNEESIQIIERLDFTGENYLASTDIELQKYNLTPGAVKRILDELKKQANRDAVNDLSNETQRDITLGKKGETSVSSERLPSLDVNKPFEDQQKLVNKALGPEIQKKTNKRSFLMVEDTNLDDIDVLREEFRRLFDAGKYNDKLSFRQVVNEVTRGSISEFTVSKFYNGKSDLSVGHNKTAIRDWVENQRKKRNTKRTKIRK